MEDLQSGKYKVTYELTLAGVHSMSVKMQGFLGTEEVTYMPECLPCSVDLSKTMVEADQFLGNWIAGDWAEAKVVRCDRFGNKVRTRASQVEDGCRAAGAVRVAHTPVLGCPRFYPPLVCIVTETVL